MAEQLITHLISTVVSKPQEVSVSLRDIDGKRRCLIQVSPQDLPKVVDGEKRIFKAIKTITSTLLPGACEDFVVDIAS